MKKGFLKFSDERNKKYSIKTEIDFASEKKKVVKKAVYNEGNEHLDHIISSCENLEKYYSEVKLCPVRKSEAGIEFDFVEGRLLLNEYLDRMNDKDIKGYEELLLFHKDIVVGNEKNKCEFKSSKEFEQWFGDSKVYENKEGLIFSNFDAIAANIIMQDNEPVFIDYEWTVDFVMPKDLVIYHCIYDAYIHNQGLEEFYSMDKVLQLLDIKTSREDLEKNYEHFFNFVICDENGESYAKDKFKCLKPSYSVPHIAKEWQNCAGEWQRAVEANLKIQQELDESRKEWEKCANLWKEAVAANEEKDKELEHTKKEWLNTAEEWKAAVASVEQVTEWYRDLEKRFDELKKMHEELDIRYNELQNAHNEVINSKVWKLNTKLHSVLKK